MTVVGQGAGSCTYGASRAQAQPRRAHYEKGVTLTGPSVHTPNPHTPWATFKIPTIKIRRGLLGGWNLKK